MMKVLIADSGSTKTTWYCLDKEYDKSFDINRSVTADGINPVRDSAATIADAIDAACARLKENSNAFCNEQEIEEIHFYGAGCIAPYKETVERELQKRFTQASIEVESDMLGGALAMCGHNEGIACILGTGSNSCLFDGKNIIQQTPALGFILGDEGSGASLGKRLVGDILKHQLPTAVEALFLAETGLTQSEVIDQVYRQPMPNKFLASLTPFIARHTDITEVNEMVVTEFRHFLTRNIKAYGRPDLPIHFVGGITASFEKQLRTAIEQEGMKMGHILSHPITGMVEYHINT